MLSNEEMTTLITAAREDRAEDVIELLEDQSINYFDPDNEALIALREAVKYQQNTTIDKLCIKILRCADNDESQFDNVVELILKNSNKTPDDLEKLMADRAARQIECNRQEARQLEATNRMIELLDAGLERDRTYTSTKKIFTTFGIEVNESSSDGSSSDDEDSSGYVTPKEASNPWDGKLTVVLDIDYTLAENLSSNSRELRTKGLIDESSIIVAADHEHYIYHGSVAFIKFLDSLGAKLAFFSNGIKERNEEFVEKLLKKSLGVPRYNELKRSISIKSKNDCFYTSRIQGKERDSCQPKYIGFQGDAKKDLNQVNAVELGWTVLIDDTRNYMLSGQEGNLLKVYGFAAKLRILNNTTEEEFKGDPEEAFISLNRIFYAAGVLLTALEKTEELNISLAQSLFKLQFKADESGEFEPIYHVLLKEGSLYQKGLSKLKEFDSSLEFLGTQTVANIFSNPQNHARALSLGS